MVSNHILFSIFHLTVLTTMLNRRQAIPDRLAIRESMPQLGILKTHAPLVSRHKQDQPTTLLSWGPSPHPNWDSKPLPLSPRLNAVQGPPNSKTTLTVGPERAGSTTREQQVFQVPIPKYVLGIISLTYLEPYAMIGP